MILELANLSSSRNSRKLKLREYHQIYSMYEYIYLVMSLTAVKCPEIDLPAGSSRNDSAHVYNTYVEYSCDDGKRMRDGATWRILKCDATREWSDNVTECDCEWE